MPLDFGGDSQFRQQNRLRGIRLLQRLDFGGDSQFRHQNRRLLEKSEYAVTSLKLNEMPKTN